MFISISAGEGAREEDGEGQGETGGNDMRISMQERGRDERIGVRREQRERRIDTEQGSASKRADKQSRCK